MTPQLLTYLKMTFHRFIGEYNYTWFRADPETGLVDVVFVGDDGGTIDSIALQL